MTDPIEYISANRDRYTREAITEQLVKAGHDPGSIKDAWARSDAAVESAAYPAGRPRYGLVALVLLALGGLVTFVIWSDLYAAGGFIATLSYVITGLVTMGIGIALTRAASGRAWAAVVVLGVTVTAGLLWVAIGNSVNGYVDGASFLAAALAAVTTAAVIAVHQYQAQIPYLAYALPVLGWLAVTGICMSPLLTGV